MKRILINGLVLSSVLLADCTQAENLFANSRDEPNFTKKIALITQAKKICDIPQIDIELKKFQIDGSIEKGELKGLEIALQNLSSKNGDLDEKYHRFQFNTQREIGKLFRKLYEKQKALESKKGFVTSEANIKNLDTKLKSLDMRLDSNSVKSLHDIGGMYKSELRFSKNSSLIKDREEAKNIRETIADVFSKTPNAQFSILGYASSGGTKKHNDKLSRDRASSLKSFIGAVQNIKTFAKGETLLVCRDEMLPEADEYGEYRCVNGEDKIASRRVQIRRIR